MDRAMAGEPVLKIKDLSISYQTKSGAVNAVRDVSFNLYRGEAMGLVGESGCGKSTAALALMGYVSRNAQIEEGQVLFRGENILEMSENKLRTYRGRKLAMVYQDPLSTLNPSFRIGNQLMEVLAMHTNLSKQESREKCVEMLNNVKIPDPETVFTRYPHQLSGGQLQRVVIAMALLCNPEVLIMDEPTTGLDVTVQATVLDMIRDLRHKFDGSILYVSHDLSVVASVCDRVSVMYAGEIVEKADVDHIFLDPVHPYTKGLIRSIPKLTHSKYDKMLFSIPGRVEVSREVSQACSFRDRCKYEKEICESDHPELKPISDRREVRCFLWEEINSREDDLTDDLPAYHQDREVIRETELLRTENLKKYYGVEQSLMDMFQRRQKQTVKAVDGISMVVNSHKVMGIVGESGCGKSTLAKTIAGLIEPTEGEIYFKEEDISRIVEKRPREILRELGMVFQNPNSTLNPTHTVGEIIGRPLRIAKDMDEEESKNEVINWLTRVRLDESYYNRRPTQLSGGERQRVAIARAFVSRPELVICDEPVSSLDVSVQSSVLNTLIALQESQGSSVIYISHNLNIVHYLCDAMIVMYLGEVCESGSREEVFSPPYHPYTEALLSSMPVPDPTMERVRIRLEGAVPSALEPPTGCRFHTRCHRKIGEVCEKKEPPLQKTPQGHAINCHIPLAELSQSKPVIVDKEIPHQ